MEAIVHASQKRFHRYFDINFFGVRHLFCQLYVPDPEFLSDSISELIRVTRCQHSTMRPRGEEKSRKARSSASLKAVPLFLFTSWATAITSSCRLRTGTHKTLEAFTMRPLSAARAA